MLVKELIVLLEKENPEAEAIVYFNKKIESVSGCGGDSFATKLCWIWPEQRW